MSHRFEKLKGLLKELFQLDQPDLDFGFYRVMHAKSAEVTQFLEKDLLPQVKAAFAEYQPADKAAMEKELAELRAGIERAGMDPGQSPKVQDLEKRLQEDAVDLNALEAEVYDHLYSFFRRYYTEGDFLSKRVYKPGVYAIPYEGEEVKLHWANSDQYYIKTSEYLRDYAFRLQPDDDKDPMRVHFRLVDAVEGEHGNVKATEGKGRVFIAAADDLVAEEEGEEGKELVVRFEYRPSTLTDWPEDVREGKKKPPTQKDLIALAEERVFAATEPTLGGWVEVLRHPHVKSDGQPADYSRLRAHLTRYAARNTFDYFIHKNLGEFLRRELDFYIKNEVMHLDDIESETAPRVEQYLSKIKVIRRIAGKVIEFLAQLEEFQKRLWLKKKFVVETSWCIRVGCIPEEFYPEIAANDAQREEWVRLLAIDEIEGDLVTAGYSRPLETAFLAAHPTLVVDTQYFTPDFTERLMEAVNDLEDTTDGVLFHGENYQALSLMQARYRKRVSCTYIDPPYNTGSDENFPYKDQYQHSTWLSLISDRLSANRSLLADHGVFLSSIGIEEHGEYDIALKEVFGEPNKLAELAWEKGRKNDARRFSVGHDYVLVYARNASTMEHLIPPWREPKTGIKPIIEEYHRLKKEHPGEYDLLSNALATWFARLPKDHPSRKFQRAKHVDARGIWRDNNISWPGGGGPRYDLMHPVTNKPCLVPRDGWRFIEKTMKEKVEDGFVVFREDHTESPFLKSYIYIDGGCDEGDKNGGQPQVMGSVFYKHSQPSNDWMKDLFGMKAFANPKDHEILSRLIRYVTPSRGIVLDFFAGSGSTAHAAIDLNRSDSTKYRWVLAEVGQQFETVLLSRLKKVTFSPEWKDGKPKRLATEEEAERSPRIMKVVHLESYEDTLSNLETRRSKGQQSLLNRPEAGGPNGLKEQYTLRYMLDVETRGSASLLNITAFTDPTTYKLKVKSPGSDESREVNADLLETFNWLIGLTVHHIAAPLTFTAAFKQDDDRDLPEGSPRRLLLDGRLKQSPSGAWWFRTVTGKTPDGRKALVIWRKRPGGETPEGIEQDNLVLDEWFTKQGYSSKDTEFDLIYVNGDNNLENLKAPDDTWKVRLIEEDFHRLMFETEGV